MTTMRKPRDIDAELKALQDKQKQLRARRTVQFGELVTATGADVLDAETLAGALLRAVEHANADPSTKEAWRRTGEGFFRRERGAKPNRAGHTPARVAGDHNGAAPDYSGAPAG
jgi:DNA-binding protein H-NS